MISEINRANQTLGRSSSILAWRIDFPLATGRWGEVTIEDFIKVAAKEELDKRLGAAGGNSRTRNAPQVSPESRAKAANISLE